MPRECITGFALSNAVPLDDTHFDLPASGRVALLRVAGSPCEARMSVDGRVGCRWARIARHRDRLGASRMARARVTGLRRRVQRPPAPRPVSRECPRPPPLTAMLRTLMTSLCSIPMRRVTAHETAIPALWRRVEESEGREAEKTMFSSTFGRGISHHGHDFSSDG